MTLPRLREGLASLKEVKHEVHENMTHAKFKTAEYTGPVHHDYVHAHRGHAAGMLGGNAIAVRDAQIELYKKSEEAMELFKTLATETNKEDGRLHGHVSFEQFHQTMQQLVRRTRRR